MKNVTYINAGAGSGKTHRLTETLTKLIKEDRKDKVRPEQVILTTYTVKAANEFKEKAKAFLYNEGLYEEAIQLDNALIGTVHSVCQRMIGKYWFNLGLAPDMGVMSEEDTEFYISQSLAELPTDDELAMLHSFCKEFDIKEVGEDYTVKGLDYNFWQKHLKNIIKYATNYELSDFEKSKEESLKHIAQFVNNHTSFDFTYNELKAVIDEHEAFLRSCKQSAANDGRIEKLVKARRYLHTPTLETLKDINSTIGTPKKYGLLATAFQEKMNSIWTSKWIYDKQEGYINLLFDLAQRWQENFAQFKREKNLLTYDDMEKYMWRLMQDDTIKNEISKSYRFLFVDEFQDSSPIQVKIFDALSDLMEHSYWVGDYKQSIYGFRGSDVPLIKAVVDRVASLEDGCDTDCLDKSWRSLPDIVEVNNRVFEKAFAHVLEEDDIHLNKKRKNEDEIESLLYFKTSNDMGVAEHVLKLLHQGVKPSDIAVLNRENEELNKVAKELKRLGIPSSRVGLLIKDTASYALVMALLRIVCNDNDLLAKATVAFLAEEDYTLKHIIETKILHDNMEGSTQTECFADTTLVRHLLALRPKLQQQSVASLVESMIVGLDLYDLVKAIEEDATFGESCLQTIITTAHMYEEHCLQMNLPATIDGFIAYIEQLAPTGNGDPNGVQLHTYHSCKGLQWKYAILMSLNKNVCDLNKTISREMYGVSAIHSKEPTTQNMFPETYIRLTPWVYGNLKNVPNEISLNIEEMQAFKDAYKKVKDENNRVLYVGMTRPRDVLMLHINANSKQPLLWPQSMGLSTATSVPDGDCDLLGVEKMFKDFTLTTQEAEVMEPYSNDTRDMQLHLQQPSIELRKPRDLSPSHIQEKGEVVASHDFKARIPFAHQPQNMSIVGDCIHQIFASIEEVKSGYKIEMSETIKSYGLEEVLCDEGAIATAWNNLADYLTKHHAPMVKTYHERPFRLEREGQTIVGSIDLVWQTEEGSILIDYKTCPMGVMAITSPESEHYAGRYAGQLNAYADAMSAAGEKVLKRYVYYPVSGLLVEIGS